MTSTIYMQNAGLRSWVGKLGSGGSEPLGQSTIWPTVADWTALSTITSPRDGDRASVGSLGVTGNSIGVARYVDANSRWELIEGAFVSVTAMNSFAQPTIIGAVALVDSSVPTLGSDAVTYVWTGSWTRLASDTAGFAWTLTGLFDFSQVGLKDGDFGIWTPSGGSPIMLRYKAATVFSGGGTRPVWMTPEAYAGTPVLQAWTDGTEDNTALATQGWTIVNDAGCSVTATGGFQRLACNGTSVGSRLRTMIGTVSAATRIEQIFETRADSIASGAGVVWPNLTVDGTNLLAVGQIYGSSGGFGFNDGTGLGGPLQTPLRNNLGVALPILSATAAVCVLRDEGRTVLASLSRDGFPLGDYRRNLQTNISNFIQVSCIRFAPAGTLNMDFRGQIITY